MCPSCLSGGLGPGYIAAFIVCGLFFVVTAGSLLLASRTGRLDGLEDSKYRMLHDEE